MLFKFRTMLFIAYNSKEWNQLELLSNLLKTTTNKCGTLLNFKNIIPSETENCFYYKKFLRGIPFNRGNSKSEGIEDLL
ncbi:hypothetical protein CAEBREN_04510 [Caenorhabditis brenneri]|uniref:Uncharacterized protein n=1 Tax=Caenorhabditis brenneri TaxID=135651 RepID=G0NYB1_CAEBE|nr:hypothetical protein CAEBREN_04510 [Caenorhabditis brenneri]